MIAYESAPTDCFQYRRNKFPATIMCPKYQLADKKVKYPLQLLFQKSKH